MHVCMCLHVVVSSCRRRKICMYIYLQKHVRSHCIVVSIRYILQCWCLHITRPVHVRLDSVYVKQHQLLVLHLPAYPLALCIQSFVPLVRHSPTAGSGIERMRQRTRDAPTLRMSDSVGRVLAATSFSAFKKGGRRSSPRPPSAAQRR